MNTPKGKIIAISPGEATEQEAFQLSFGIEEEILKDVIKETGRSNPEILILPVYSIQQKQSEDQLRKVFERLGLNPSIIRTMRKSDLDSNENLQRINNADCLFLSGDDQVKLRDMLIDTHFLNIVKRRYSGENFTIAGIGAAAVIMSEYIIEERHSELSLKKGMIKLTEGLEFLPGTIIDTRILGSGRIERLADALIQERDCTGISISENTAIVITEGNEIRIVGPGTVTIMEVYDLKSTNYDSVKENEPVFAENLIVHFLSKGASYLLKEKKILVLDLVSANRPDEG